MWGGIIMGRKKLDIDEVIADEDIIKSSIKDEVESSMLTYAIKTITDRAIPDVRDGLKPVQRRILYGAYNNRYLPDKKHVKNAKIVGDVMGNYHPHGDGAIYGALVNMSQPWSYRYPLVNFHGNNGSYDGDSAAAMRYTEGKLSNISMNLLNDVENNSVKFAPNYSEELEEPTVLPGLLPNLLLNGTYGIATGYTTRIPSHQLGETIDGIIHFIKNSNCDIEDLMKHIKAPDFPNGGYLVKNGAIKKLYKNGKARLTFKAKYKIEKNEESGNEQIIITELPPITKKPKLVKKMHKLCVSKDKKIPNVVDVRDESEGEEVRVVIELHKSGVPDLVINELYDKTKLQKKLTYTMRAIVGKTPRTLNLKQMIDYYVEHRRKVVTNKTKHLLKKAEDKLHIQKGLKVVTDDIDKAIEIVKRSRKSSTARSKLMKEFNLSKEQAQKVLDIKLRQLTKLNKTKLDDLIRSLKKDIKRYKLILSDINELNKVIIGELKELKDEFNDKRRTEIINEKEAEELEIVSEEANAILALTSKNRVKQISEDRMETLYNRGNYRERFDIFEQCINCHVSDEFIVILDNGRYVRVEFNDLIGDISFINQDKDKIKAIIPFNSSERKKDTEDTKGILMVTKKGNINKVPISGFRARLGRKANLLKLDADDEIVSVRITDLNDDNIITIATENGVIHRFFEKSFKSTNAGGKGINGIDLRDEDRVVDLEVSKKENDENNKIVLFTIHDDQHGMKSMELTKFKPKGRIAKGKIGVKFGKRKPGKLDKVLIVNDDFTVLGKKGAINEYKFNKLSNENEYKQPDMIDHKVITHKLYLE
jgi:DNA gyrase subunit A